MLMVNEHEYGTPTFIIESIYAFLEDLRINGRLKFRWILMI
jgi:hypothetical protein